MSDQTSYIASLCAQLSQQGKQPSVALIRKLANQSLSLPIIISVLKKWKEDPEFLATTIDEVNTSVQTEVSDSQRLNELEKRVQLLESKLASVTAQLDRLTHSGA